MTGRARLASVVLAALVAAVAAAGLVALATSDLADPDHLDASKRSAIVTRGPLDAGLRQVRARRASPGDEVVFRLALDDTGPAPLVLRRVDVILLDDALEVRGVRALDPDHPGRTTPLDGAVLRPLRSAPDDQLGGIELRLAAVRPADASAVGLRVTYEIAGVRHTAEVWDAFGICARGGSGGCRPATLSQLDHLAGQAG